jgi:hypothetical protein
MEVRKAQTSMREGIYVRGVDLRAKATQLSKTGVIEQNDHDVGSVLARVIRLIEPRLRLSHGPADLALKRGCAISVCCHSLRSDPVQPDSA